MNRLHSAYLVATVFVAAAAIAYCATLWVAVPLPRYYPTLHVWKWVNDKGVPSQAWYGMQLFAYLAGTAAAAAAWLLARLFRVETLSPSAVRWLGGLSVAITLFGMGAMLVHEFRRWHVLG